METNQTLTCSGANGGSFALVYDGRTTHKLDHDATASEVQHALHSLPTLNEGDVRVETLHSCRIRLMWRRLSLVIAFTTPLGNQPPLEIISSLLKNGEPGGTINIQHTTGTRERLECNGAGFNVTIDFQGGQHHHRLRWRQALHAVGATRSPAADHERAPAPATRASSGTPTTAVAAGPSSTRRPGRGCSAALDM